MRALEVILVDDVVDALATMSSDVLGVRVLEFLVMLYCEVLFLDILFEFFSLYTPVGRLLQAFLDLGWVVSVTWGSSPNTTIRHVAILEFVDELELFS